MLDEGRLAEELFREVKAWKQEGGGKGRTGRENGLGRKPGPAWSQASFLPVAPVTKARQRNNKES